MSAARLPASSPLWIRAGGRGLFAPSHTQRDHAQRHRHPRVRFYKNLWGANKPTGLEDQHKCPTVRSDEVASHGNWRLDWEEDRRYVEWRRDQGDEQTEEERAKVTKEWVRFRDSQGRDRAKLWDDRGQGAGTSGFSRGSEDWWRRKYYDYEFTGASGVRSMEDVQRSLAVLQVTDAGDAPAIRAAYLRLVGKWHPDRHQKAEDKEKAAEMFRQVSDAYNLLKERS